MAELKRGQRSLSLIATLSYFPNGSPYGNSTTLEDFKTSATPVSATIYFTDVDVPSEYFTQGFVNGKGETLMTPSGTILDSWFALDFKSSIKLGPNNPPGNYEFAMLSDDGSILSIDSGQGLTPIVSADHVQSSTFTCSSVTIPFTASSLYPVDIQYFQGPPVSIAAVMMWRLVPAGGTLNTSGCDYDGGDHYYFTEPSNGGPNNPLQPYLNLLSEGWAPLTPDNFVLPKSAGTNPCVSPSPSPSPSGSSDSN